MYRHHIGALPVGAGLLTPVFDSPAEVTSAQSHRDPQDISGDHPLQPVLDLARDVQRRAEQQARIFECQLIKRERIDGELQGERIIDLHVIDENRGRNDRLALRMDFSTPDDIAGRRILFVEGQHENKMLVRKGGARFKFLTLRLSPDGYKAHAESLVPIAQISFPRIVAGMVASLQKQMELDPRGDNTTVQWDEDASMDGRACRLVRICHPQRDEALGFYVVAVYLDCQLGLPTRVEAYDWPAESNDPPPLIAEYTFSNLQIGSPVDSIWYDPDSLHKD
jgi:hypothetical protein